MSIQELIQKNKSEFDEKIYDLIRIKSIAQYNNNGVNIGFKRSQDTVLNWHTQSLKSLIDAVIEEEEKEIDHIQKHSKGNYADGKVEAKNDTINRLKAIREML